MERLQRIGAKTAMIRKYVALDLDPSSLEGSGNIPPAKSRSNEFNPVKHERVRNVLGALKASSSIADHASARAMEAQRARLVQRRASEQNPIEGLRTKIIGSGSKTKQQTLLDAMPLRDSTPRDPSKTPLGSIKALKRSPTSRIGATAKPAPLRIEAPSALARTLHAKAQASLASPNTQGPRLSLRSEGKVRHGARASFSFDPPTYDANQVADGTPSPINEDEDEEVGALELVQYEKPSLRAGGIKIAAVSAIADAGASAPTPTGRDVRARRVLANRQARAERQAKTAEDAKKQRADREQKEAYIQQRKAEAKQRRRRQSVAVQSTSLFVGDAFDAKAALAASATKNAKGERNSRGSIKATARWHKASVMPPVGAEVMHPMRGTGVVIAVDSASGDVEVAFKAGPGLLSPRAREKGKKGGKTSPRPGGNRRGTISNDATPRSSRTQNSPTSPVTPGGRGGGSPRGGGGKARGSAKKLDARANDSFLSLVAYVNKRVDRAALSKRDLTTTRVPMEGRSFPFDIYPRELMRMVAQRMLQRKRCRSKAFRVAFKDRALR